MHQLLSLAIVVGLTFATAGHSKMFAASYDAAARGEISQAAGLFKTAIVKSISDAGEQERQRNARRAGLVAVSR
jgi:hypothetical protein